MMGNLYESMSSSPDNLIAGPSDLILDEEITVASGAGVLPRGSVLGRITASGEYVLVQSDGDDDGRRTAHRILAQDVDATDTAVVTVAYLAGEFNESALTFGGTDDADDHREALKAKGIILRTSVSAI